MEEVDRSKLYNVVVRRLFISQVCLIAACGVMVVILSIITSHLGSFVFSFFFGCIGGSISLLRRMNKESFAVLDAVAHSWITTLMPLMYGGVMALVAYMLFMSGILTGDGGSGLFTSNLFPNFHRPDVPEGSLLTVPMILGIRPADIAEAGKLLVWSFLAGYSEKFVTSVLGALEDRSGAK